MIEWKDFNGNYHLIHENVVLQHQQPNCKYLLPCGLCALHSDLPTCSILKGVNDNEDNK